MLPDLKEIPRRRRGVCLTQSRFAKEAGLSRSMLAKIERGYANPSYGQAKRIFETLDRLEEAMTKKTRLWEAGQIHNTRVVFAEYGEPITLAQARMQNKFFSQLPVMREGKVVGSITEKGIAARIFGKELPEMQNMLVSDFLEEAFPQISTKTPVNLIIPLLQRCQAVLTMKEGKVIGIITNSDVLKHLLQT
jgi:predicted transcriptional regulator